MSKSLKLSKTKSFYSRSAPKQIRLKQAVSKTDITERVKYIEKCIKSHCPVDMRQMVNLYRLAELYNSAVSSKQKKRPRTSSASTV